MGCTESKNMSKVITVNKIQNESRYEHDHHAEASKGRRKAKAEHGEDGQQGEREHCTGGGAAAQG